jgi:hypothetical protein
MNANTVSARIDGTIISIATFYRREITAFFGVTTVGGARVVVVTNDGSGDARTS